MDRQHRHIRVTPDEPTTWIKYHKKFCADCMATCCSLPVEVKTSDLIRMGLMAACEEGSDLRFIARRLIKACLIEHFHHRSATLTLARMANGDCCYLDSRTRRCTIYERRPDTCRNHPQVGPRSGYCAYTPKTR